MTVATSEQVAVEEVSNTMHKARFGEVVARVQEVFPAATLAELIGSGEATISRWKKVQDAPDEQKGQYVMNLAVVVEILRQRGYRDGVIRSFAMGQNPGLEYMRLVDVLKMEGGFERAVVAAQRF